MPVSMPVVVEGQHAPHGNVKSANRAAAGRREPTREERIGSLITGRWRDVLSFGVVLVAIVYGWQRRGDVYLSPEQGLGYALGIAGATMMALLMLYPVRKHARWMRRFGEVRYWFRAHMIMGIAGPLCILYHCNFQLGSMNGNVALFCMLLVSSSGLLGRYFYTRIHYGLYGRRADLAHLGSDAVVIRSYMHRVFAVAPELQDVLTSLEKKTLRQPHGFIGCLGHVLHISFKSRWCGLVSVMYMRRAQVIIISRDRLQDDEIHKLRVSSKYYLRLYLETIRRVAGFTFYERLFSLWHVLHFPLFVMLLITGVIHVYAVHFY
jgi:hypothetical protein